MSSPEVLAAAVSRVAAASASRPPNRIGRVTLVRPSKDGFIVTVEGVLPFPISVSGGWADGSGALGKPFVDHLKALVQVEAMVGRRVMVHTADDQFVIGYTMGA